MTLPTCRSYHERCTSPPAEAHPRGSSYLAPGARKAEKLTSTDTLANNQEPTAENVDQPTEHSHEGHVHDHDHDHHGHDHSHDHQHGPVLNPECTRELVLDMPVEDVSKAYRNVTRNYQKYAKIPGFRAGKVPETVVKRRFAEQIRKEVIDGLLPEKFNQAVRELGVAPVGPAAGYRADRGRRPAAACEGGVRVHPGVFD